MATSLGPLKSLLVNTSRAAPLALFALAITFLACCFIILDNKIDRIVAQNDRAASSTVIETIELSPWQDAWVQLHVDDINEVIVSFEGKVIYQSCSHINGKEWMFRIPHNAIPYEGILKFYDEKKLYKVAFIKFVD